MKKRTILIVDDNQINRLMLEKILTPYYNVLQAENGKAALLILENGQESISAVLTDLIMPIMNGYEFLRQFNKNQNISSIPVIVATQLGSEDVELKALSLGAEDFITKPYKPEIILKRLENIIKLHETSSFISAIEHDSLTFLYNKQSFYRYARQILNKHLDTDYIIAAIDIEKFKLVNDLYGRQEGDNLLSFLADNLRNFAKVTDSICGRFTADKFVLLIPYSDGFENALINFIIKPIDNYHLKIKINVKIGLYQIADKDITVAAMCDRAQIAASSIKGIYVKQIVYYDDAILDCLKKRQEIVDEMNKALLNEEFKVFYQIECDLRTGKPIGAEALTRWFHQEKGLIPPDEFIPIFEENGFITKLDYYVWEQTCKLIRDRMDKGQYIFPISVNVSRVDIFCPQFIELLVGLVRKYDIPPKFLRLEITETAYAENEEYIGNIVNELKSEGFFIEMDDFGSRYSSLNMLSAVNVDCIKLDIAFLQNIEKNPRNGCVLSFVIRLAKWLGLSVIAEGVETRHQALMLREMGCDIGQGYYFSRPLKVEDFLPLIDKELLADFSSDEIKTMGLSMNDIWDSESAFNLIFNDFTNALCIIEFAGDKPNIIRANREYYEILNSRITSMEHLTKCVFDEDLPKVKEVLNSSQIGVSSPYVEIRVRECVSCDRYRWFALSFRELFKDCEKRVFLVSILNTTEQKKLEMQLTEELNFYKSLVKTQPNS
ncbi:MAG: EAL domain-containing protein [Oscillospiraceae bacterium]